jgi:TRAP-type C4-dicarboxylate transport system permease small subunit
MDRQPRSEDARQPGLVAKVAATAVMSGIVVCVALQVVSRYVAHIQVSWTEEAARLLLLWVAAVGAVLAVATRSHFRFDLLAARLPVPARRALDLTVMALTAVFLLAFLASGILYSLDMADARSQLLGISYGIPYAAVPLGAAGMLLALWSRFRARRGDGGEGA